MLAPVLRIICSQYALGQGFSYAFLDHTVLVGNGFVSIYVVLRRQADSGADRSLRGGTGRCNGLVVRHAMGRVVVAQR